MRKRMKAVILVGGKATRLLPLTVNTPKSMVPVLNIPFLEHLIRHLSKHQVKDIVLAQGHLSQPIQGYLNNGNQFGVNLHYVVEDNPLGTAGAIKNTEKYLDDTFLVLNGDTFTDLDITAMIDLHQKRKAKVTIATTSVDDPTSYGLIETNDPADRDRITQFLEKPSRDKITTNKVNAGTYVIEPDVLSYIRPQAEVSIERETLPLLLGQGEPIYAYHSSAYWIDIGRPESYLQLHRELLNGKSKQYDHTRNKGVALGKQSYIHPTAQIKSPVLIGNNCSIKQGVKLIGPVVIGSNCTILEDTVIEDSIIWQNTQLGEHVRLKNSIVANDCRIDADSTIDNSILANNVTVTNGCRLEAGSRIWPGTTVKPKT